MVSAVVAAIAASLVLTHVNVVDVRHGSLESDRTVVVRGDRIAAIEASTNQKWPGAKVVDGRGKFLIPGLWDMEVHLSWCKESSLALLVVNGVTNVRDMGGSLAEIERWQAGIASRRVIGPSILQVGPMLNGKSFNRYQLAIQTPEQAGAVVRTLKIVGVDGLEIERRVPQDVYAALMTEAKREQLPVGGHVPLSITPEHASNLGQTTIDNIESLYYGTFAQGIEEKNLPEAIKTFLRSPKSDALFRTFARNHTAVSPVLGTLDWTLRQMSPGATSDPNDRYVAQSLEKEAAKELPPQEALDTLNSEYPLLRETVRKLHHDGVTLLAATDIAGARIPGFSLHRDLQQLVSAGIPPLAALQAATINASTVVRKSKDFGTIELGKVANMVLLDANPLIDIENTQRIRSVVLEGRFLGRDRLDALLRRAETLAHRE